MTEHKSKKMSLAWKKLATKKLRDVGVKAFDVAAVNKLAEQLHTDGGSDDALDEFIRVWTQDGDKGDRLTVEAVDAVLALLRGGGRQQLAMIAVVNAFDVPKISYDPVGRKLYHDTKLRSIFAPAQAKQQLYLDRLLLINQRIRRNSIFQPRALAGGTGAVGPQLTDIQSLKGVVGKRKFVVGCISRAEDGRYVLEDNSGTVPINLAAAQTAAGFYTENCIVIAEGEMQVDGIFHAAAMGFPPCEAREDLPMAAQRLNFFGGPAVSPEDAALMSVEETERDDDRIVVLASVHLDSSEVMASLGKMFSKYNECDPLPTMFVLMGNFHSRGASSGVNLSAAMGADMDYAVMRDNFNALAALIEQSPRVKENCRFVFVPGPGDPSPSTALPQPPLPAYLTGDLRRVLPNAVFASNPCRVRYLTQQIVFFCYDILSRMRRRCLIPPKDLGTWLEADAAATQEDAAAATQATSQAMWGHLALTLLQQSHLCPLPLLQQPVYWQYDHALQLYPMPHAVVVADASPRQEFRHDGCVVFNPGSFAERAFCSYKPCEQKVENIDVPHDGIAPEYEEEQEEAGAEEGEGAEGRFGDVAGELQEGEDVLVYDRGAAVRGGKEERGPGDGRSSPDVRNAGDQGDAGARSMGRGEGGEEAGLGVREQVPGEGMEEEVGAAAGEALSSEEYEPDVEEGPASKRHHGSGARAMIDQEMIDQQWDTIIADDSEMQLGQQPLAADAAAAAMALEEAAEQPAQDDMT